MKLEEFREILKKYCPREVEISSEAEEKFYQYLKILKKWNKIHNLTAIRKDEEIIKRHFCESLYLIKFFKDINYEIKGKSLADVGTGAGFPGMPLKLVCPNLEVNLIEISMKKCAFLQFLKSQLKVDVKLHCTDARLLNIQTNIAVTRALEVRGKKVNSPLIYAYEILKKLATDLIVIMKGSNIPWDNLPPLKIYSIDSQKILYQFLKNPEKD